MRGEGRVARPSLILAADDIPSCLYPLVVSAVYLLYAVRPRMSLHSDVLSACACVCIPALRGRLRHPT
jgi:hypothetical protein